MPTVCMGAYRAGVAFQCLSGAQYTADSNGYVSPATLADLNDLLKAGGVHIPQGMVGPGGVTGATGP